MKKKLSMLMVALVAIAAFATTMSLTNARRVVSELAVVSEATTWDFSTDVTLASTYSGDFKADDKTVENIYANFDVLTFGENFKADALAFTGEYPFRSNSKKFAQNGTLHFKTSVAGKIVVKFSDTGSSASATAVKRYLVVNGVQTDYWASRENNGEDPYPAQLNVTTDEIEVPAGDVTIAGSSAIIVSYVSWAPNATPEPAGGETSYTIKFKDSGSADGTAEKTAIVDLIAEGAEYVSAVTAAKVFQGKAGYGIKFSSAKVDGSLSLTLAQKVAPTKITVKAQAWLNSSNVPDEAKLSINGNEKTLTSELADYEVTLDGKTEITAISLAATKRLYVTEVTVTYVGGSDEPQPAGPTTLINYPTSQEGITIGGTTTFDKVKIHVNTDEVSGIKFANGYVTDGAVNDNKALLEVEGGFKAGDKITIAGAFNNSDDAKNSAIDIFTIDAESKPTVLFTTQKFVNGRTSADDPAAEEFTLTADVDKLYLGRNGNTGTFVTLLTITRPGEEPQPAEADFVYDFAAEQALIAASTVEKPSSVNGNQNNGQGFYGWETSAKTDSKRNDYKSYGKKEGSQLPDVNHVWRRSDRYDQDASWANAGGLTCPNDREYAIDGLTPGSKVVIEYDATNATDKEIVWATGDGSSESMSYRANATINGVEAVSGETVIPSGAEILVTRVTPAVKGTGYIVVKVKKNMVISKISIWQNKEAVAYNVTVAEGIENGSIKVTRSVAYEGDEVNVIATPASAKYELEAITAMKGEEAVQVVDGNFIMPAGDVVVNATFFSPYVPVATLAELKQKADGDNFNYTSEATVVAQGKSGNYAYTYIKDETASTVIFDKDGSKTPAEAVGKKIAKDWVGTVSVYHGLFELVPAAALTLAEGEAQEVKYPVVDFDYVTAEHAAEVVMLSGVTYSFVNEEELTITKGEQQIAALNKFGLNPGFAKKDVEYNIIGAINVYDEKVEFWPVAFVEKPTVDIEVNPEPGTDISEAIAEASKGHFVRNITINLQVADGAAPYTITQSIVAPASIRIFGNGAGIDASALEGALVTTPEETPEEWITGLDFFMDNVAIKGLSKALFATAGKNRAYEAFSVNNSVIEVAGDVTVFDFTKGSTALIFNVSTSTIYAPKATSKSLYSSQGGQKATELNENATQHFNFLGSTFYNLATGKNFFSHRQSNQKWLTYSAHNNIFVNCGKNGQTIVGMNGGQTGTNPTWSIANNAFNFVTVNEDGSFISEDTGAKEDNKDADEPITATIAGSVYFQDAANTNFAIDATCAAATPQIGDTRWGTWAPEHYMIAVSEEALQYADITVQPFALEDEVVKVAVTEKNGFKLKELIAKVGTQTTLKVTDNSFIMPPANVGIDAAFDVVAADYELAPAAGTDIAAALEGLIIRNLKLTLAEGGAYTLTKSIELGGNLEIIGNGATIDASGIEVTTGEGDAAVAAAAPFIILSGSETFAKKADETDSDHYLIASATIKDVTVKGLKDAFIKDNQKTLLEKLTIENAIIEMPDAQKNVIDFSDKGYVGEVVVNKSTIYAPTKNTGFFAQYGSRPKNVNGDWLQQFDVQNSTIVNIANGKNFCDLKQNGTAQNVYTLKNNIFADCGKAGQVVVGFNKGQASNAPVWNVDGNLFMLNGANNNAAEVAKAGKHFVGDAENVTEEDIVQNSVEAIVTFAAVATGDFNYSYVKDPHIAELPAIGDPRWTATVGGVAYAINVDEAIENGTVTASKTWSAADETIKLTVTPAEGYELETLTAKIGVTEIEIAEDKSFIMPAADVTVSATFIAVPKLYIIGGPKDWNLADMTELKYNLETQTYELDYAPTATAYFAFADKQFTAEEAAAEGAWDVFNATNRIALGEGDIEATLNEPVDLKKVNGTIILKAGTYKISVTKDLKVTIAGEPAPEPTVEKLFIMGTATAKGWDGTTEMTFNEADQAFEYELENADKIYITFGDAEFTDWGDFNANHRFAIAGGDNVAPVGEEFTLVKVEGTLVLEAGAYKISVTKDLKCKITAVPTGINAIAVDKLDNAVIYNLQGQRVEKSQAKGGVFIVNGKKMYLK